VRDWEIRGRGRAREAGLCAGQKDLKTVARRERQIKPSIQREREMNDRGFMQGGEKTELSCLEGLCDGLGEIERE